MSTFPPRLLEVSYPFRGSHVSRSGDGRLRSRTPRPTMPHGRRSAHVRALRATPFDPQRRERPQIASSQARRAHGAAVRRRTCQIAENDSSHAQVDFGSAHLPVLRVTYGTPTTPPASCAAARDARTCDKTRFRHPILTTALWY